MFATKHPHVKVLKLIASEASHTLSHRSLPAFLVYKNKELVADSSVAIDGYAFGNSSFCLHDVEIFLCSRYSIDLSGIESTEHERREAVENARIAEDAAANGRWNTNHFHAQGRVKRLMTHDILWEKEDDIW